MTVHLAHSSSCSSCDRGADTSSTGYQFSLAVSYNLVQHFCFHLAKITKLLIRTCLIQCMLVTCVVEKHTVECHIIFWNSVPIHDYICIIIPFPFSTHFLSSALFFKQMPCILESLSHDTEEYFFCSPIPKSFIKLLE